MVVVDLGFFLSLALSREWIGIDSYLGSCEDCCLFCLEDNSFFEIYFSIFTDGILIPQQTSWEEDQR